MEPKHWGANQVIYVLITDVFCTHTKGFTDALTGKE